jgi:hypothetical protein
VGVWGNYVNKTTFFVENIAKTKNIQIINCFLGIKKLKKACCEFWELQKIVLF